MSQVGHFGGVARGGEDVVVVRLEGAGEGGADAAGAAAGYEDGFGGHGCGGGRAGEAERGGCAFLIFR